MTTYTIDAENTIVAHASVPTIVEGMVTFASEKDLAAVSKDWPIVRLAEIWNSFAGVTPFDELKPVKKFTTRQTAIERIWNAVQRLARDGETRADDSSAKRGKGRLPDSARRKHVRANKKEARPKKKEVIAMMRRAKGATVAEIMEATGWQKHTVRGFVSILGSKSGHKIESMKTGAGERAYRILK
jgi:hypothetical protein